MTRTLTAISMPTDLRISTTAGNARLLYGGEAADKVEQQLRWSRARGAQGESRFWHEVLEYLRRSDIMDGSMSAALNRGAGIRSELKIILANDQ